MSERKICIICKKPGAYEVTNSDVAEQMRKQFYYVTSLQLHSEDGRPIMMCEQCSEQLCFTSRFKRLIICSQNAIRNRINQDANNDGNNEADPKQEQPTTSKPKDTGK